MDMTLAQTDEFETLLYFLLFSVSCVQMLGGESWIEKVGAMIVWLFQPSKCFR